MSRWLLILVGLQTVLVLVLVLKVFALEDQLAAFGVFTDEHMDSLPASTEPASLAGDAERLTEGQLRRIVSEEVAAVMSRQKVAASVNQPEPQIQEVSAEKYQARLENTMSQLEYYIAQGEISPGDMAQLQVDIARLDEESRSHVLSLLVKAVSTGELDGEL